MKRNILLLIIGILILSLAIEGYVWYTTIYNYNNLVEDEKSENTATNIDDDTTIQDTDESNETINNTNTDSNSTITLKDVYQKDDETIIEEYEVYMNNKTISLDLEFIKGMQGEGVKEAIGYIDDVKVLDDTWIDFTVDNIKAEFNTNNFEFITGTDGLDYLLVISPYYGMGGTAMYYRIYDDSLTYIDKLTIVSYFGILDDELEGYENNYTKISEFYFNLGTEILSKVEDNKIYNLYFDDCNFDWSNDDIIFEERVYTINNSKLEYTTINYYKVDVLAGGNLCNF